MGWESGRELHSRPHQQHVQKYAFFVPVCQQVVVLFPRLCFFVRGFGGGGIVGGCVLQQEPACLHAARLAWTVL